MTNEEVAKRLALITGKPTTEFFNGAISTPKPVLSQKCDSGSTPTNDTLHIKEAGDTRAEDSVSGDKGKGSETNSIAAPNKELAEYLKLFTGSTLSPSGDTIMGGRQMTRKEYLKYIKGMTSKEYYKHPLIFKIFRAEGQLDASFPSFCDRFKKNDPEVTDDD